MRALHTQTYCTRQAQPINKTLLVYHQLAVCPCHIRTTPFALKQFHQNWWIKGKSMSKIDCTYMDNTLICENSNYTSFRGPKQSQCTIYTSKFHDHVSGSWTNSESCRLVTSNDDPGLLPTDLRLGDVDSSQAKWEPDQWLTTVNLHGNGRSSLSIGSQL